MSDTENLRELASSFAKKALFLEKRGELKQAIINYSKAIQLLKKLIEIEENDAVRQIYVSRLKHYATRLKELLKTVKKVPRKRLPKEKGVIDEEADIESTIKDAIISEKPNIKWEDIADLEKAKQALLESIVWPMKRPDLFKGSRRPWRGILLFGPPGCGKTLLAKAVASNINATFFNVDSSVILSKWFGESPKIVRRLFETARLKQPSIIFMDEVDAIASSRDGGENEAMRRVKTTLLSQMDGLLSRSDDRIVIIGATNMPEDLDPAFRRRFEKRIYVPPPDLKGRKEIFRIHLRDIELDDDVDLDKLAKLTENYTGSDIALVVREASMRPIRELAEKGEIENVNVNPRKVNMNDFLEALKVIRPSLTPKEIKRYEAWAREFATA